MAVNPVLVEQTRGPLVENRHRGAFVVVDAAGTVIATAGDIERPVFPRSAIKSMQALALFASDAVGRFDLGEPELALACASHHGEAAHTSGVAAFLARLGLGEGDLECGVHPPLNAATRQALRRAGLEPGPLHNNCSGKHAGMLAVARALGAPTTGYVGRTHPVQRAVQAGIEAVLDVGLAADHCGTDGCSVPTWAVPLVALARGFARMATGEGLSNGQSAAARRLFDAATAHPHLVAGTGHFDTRVMAAFAGRLMQKGGAEGVQCGAIRDKGWGYALKCDDGNMAASQVMAARLLLQLASPDVSQRALLETLATLPLRNARGLAVGEMRAADAMDR